MTTNHDSRQQPENAEPKFGVGDASFRAAGGQAGVEALVDDFYRLMDELPDAATLRAMHPGDLTVSRDKLARFLCGWLGGPRRYAEKYGSIDIPGAHAHLAIDTTARDAWLLCMDRAIERQPFSAGFADYLRRQLRIPAGRVVNRTL